MEKQLIRTQTERQNKICRRSEVRAYHGRRSATAVHPNSERKWLGNLEIGQCIKVMKKFILFQIEGRNAGGVRPPAHITEAVASALQRKHSAAEPAGDQVGGEQSFIHQLGDPSHLAVQIGVTVTRFLRPIVLVQRRQGKLWQVEKILV